MPLNTIMDSTVSDNTRLGLALQRRQEMEQQQLDSRLILNSSSSSHSTLDDALAAAVTMTSNVTSVDEQNCFMYHFIVEGVLMGILCLVGFAGNSLSMVCLAKDRSKTATPFLLISLEATDTFFLLTVVVLRVATSLQETPDGLLHDSLPYLAKYMFPVALIAMTSTIYMTLLVTLNRYVCVCKPYKVHDWCSVRHARLHVIVVLCFAVIYNIPRFFERDVINESTPGYDVTTAEVSLLGQNRLYQLVYGNISYFIVMFFVPLLTLVALNYKLIEALRATRRRRQSMQSVEHHVSRSEDDITLTLIVVVLVFLVTQTPALVTQLALFYYMSGSSQGCGHWLFYYERVSDLLVVLNSAINFIIYCFCNRRFRQILAILLCKNSRMAREASVMMRSSYRSSYRVGSNRSNHLQVPPLNHVVINATSNGVEVTHSGARNNQASTTQNIQL